MSRQPFFRMQPPGKSNYQHVEAQQACTSEQAKHKILDSQSYAVGSKQTTLKKNTIVHQHQRENEHMGTLHARLHQEADKIRRWKIQTELDMKAKEKKLTEASLQIETMKKSLLELQLENEKTSAKLQDEMGIREDILQRINSTREMCNLLQLHASKTEDRLIKCETERTELKYTGKENMQHIEEITSQLRSFHVTTTEYKKKIENQANFERSDRIQKEETLKSKMDAAENEVQKMQNSLEEKEQEISKLNDHLQTDESKLNAMENMLDEEKKKVVSLSEEIVSKEEELKDASLRISNIQDEKSKLERNVKVLEKEYNSLQMSKDSLTLDMAESNRSLEEQLENTLQETRRTQAKLEDEQNKLKICESQLVDAMTSLDNLKNSKDRLLLEKTDLEMHLDVQKFQMNNLLTEKEEDKEEIARLNGEIDLLNKKLERENTSKLQAQYETEALQTKTAVLELEQNDLKEHCIKLENECTLKQEKIKSLESLLSEEESKAIKLQSTIDTMDQNVVKDRHLTQERESQISELWQDLYKKDEIIREKNETTKKLEETLKDLQSVNEMLEDKWKASVRELESVRCSINEKDEKMKELSTQLSDLSLQRAETGKSLTTQQKKVAATLKENRDLEKEVKTLKGKLQKESLVLIEYKEELNRTKTELHNFQKVNKDAEESLRLCEENMKKMQQQCQFEQEAAKLAKRKAEEMEANAEKEKQNAVARTDCQLAEMMATLDVYKQNNEKLVLEKDAEIQALQKRIESSESQAKVYKKFSCSSLMNSQQQILEQKSEIEKLHQQIIQHTKEKDQQQSTVETTMSQKRIPSTPVPYTPKLCVLTTPQHNILKVCNSESKRRKVSVMSKNDNAPSSSEESDLMELDTTVATKPYSTHTPLLKSTPKHKNEDILHKATPRVLPSRIPISKLEMTSGKQLQSMEDSKTSNIRKTPAKKTSKFFGPSPRSRTPTSKMQSKEKKKPTDGQQLAWFELDSVYGFGPED